MSKTITFDWSETAECIIEPGEYEIRISSDQLRMLSFLAQHGKNIVAAYQGSPAHHAHCECCGPKMLAKMEDGLEDLMYSLSTFFDLYLF